MLGVGGADGDRTHDLVNAIHARSQLRHSPTGETSSYQLRGNGSIAATVVVKDARNASTSSGRALTRATVIPAERSRRTWLPRDSVAQESRKRAGPEST